MMVNAAKSLLKEASIANSNNKREETTTTKKKSCLLRRGYSHFHSTGDPTVKGASTHTNVLIKTPLPARGIVSSNPKRVERLLEQAKELIEQVEEHTNTGWGVTIHTFRYKSVPMFIAAVPMGAAGSGFAFFEMYAAGAQAIIRYGSNDRQVAMENLRELVVVDQADNLVSLPSAAGCTDVKPDTIISASDELVTLLEAKVEAEGLYHSLMICHNVEDYHAYNFHGFFQEDDRIQQQITDLEDAEKIRSDCWDMETAALFWRAKQFGLHAATLLQNLLKKPGTSPYEGEHGAISLEMEIVFYRVIFDTLLDFSPENSCNLQCEGQ